MFHNIFSASKKEKITTKPKITIDIHEKNSLVISELKYSNQVEIEIMPLKIGDYLISNIMIERKTINDFILSMINKRLKEQIRQMQEYEKRLLIIEGSIDEIKNSKINPNALKACILSILINQLPIIFTKDYKETSEYLILLAKQQLKKPMETSMHSRIPKTIEKQKQYILEAFPNIGPQTSKKLLEKFHSLKNIFNAEEDELKDILKNKVKDFKNLIHS